jgi:hypothetical protein
MNKVKVKVEVKEKTHAFSLPPTSSSTFFKPIKDGYRKRRGNE